jgi:membrane protease YdiL (CAAX protease family)
MSARHGILMDLKIYGEPGVPPTEQRWEPRWLRWWREQVSAFDRWAAPPVEPEREEEQERSFVPVGVLLAVALAAQYLQLLFPPIRDYLLNGQVLERPAWIAFTLAKQWALFALMLLALRVREERLGRIGFPALDARRIMVALGAVGFFLGVALVHRAGVPADSWLVPVQPVERVLFVVLALTAAVVEETFFRGFAVVWTYRWSRHLPLAVLFPAAIFAAGHAYLSWLNVGFAFLVAVAFSLALVWRRDLYWLMVIHFLLDVVDLLR